MQVREGVQEELRALRARVIAAFDRRAAELDTAAAAASRAAGARAAHVLSLPFQPFTCARARAVFRLSAQRWLLRDAPSLLQRALARLRAVEADAATPPQTVLDALEHAQRCLEVCAPQGICALGS